MLNFIREFEARRDSELNLAQLATNQVDAELAYARSATWGAAADFLRSIQTEEKHQ